MKTIKFTRVDNGRPLNVVASKILGCEEARNPKETTLFLACDGGRSSFTVQELHQRVVDMLEDFEVNGDLKTTRD